MDAPLVPSPLGIVSGGVVGSGDRSVDPASVLTKKDFGHSLTTPLEAAGLTERELARAHGFVFAAAFTADDTMLAAVTQDGSSGCPGPRRGRRDID